MSNIHFEPFKGTNYSNGGCFGKKILVLGESHHGHDMGSSMTQDILYDQTYSNKTYPAYTKFERALVGYKTNCQARQNIWNSVMFYNYVQSCVPKSRQSPEQWQFDESEEAFFEILETYKPDVILVWGSRLWEALPYTNYETDDNCGYDGYEYRCGSYTTDSGLVIPCYEMQHPSSGFSWSWWHDYLTYNNII